MAEVKRLRFAVELADDESLEQTETHEVTVILGDQLRGELEAGKRGLDLKATPFHVTALWCWSALVRTGRCDLKFDRFTELCVSIDDGAEAPDADPTRPAASPGSA